MSVCNHFLTTIDVSVSPRTWKGKGLLGVTVKYDSIEEGENQGLRVLDVQRNSPAAKAGFVAYRDFIITSRDIIIRDSADLGQLIETHAAEELSLCLYNADTELIREVIIHPDDGWGGEGMLGCGIGTGLLHRIPIASKYLKNSCDSSPAARPDGAVTGSSELFVESVAPQESNVVLSATIPPFASSAAATLPAVTLSTATLLPSATPPVTVPSVAPPTVAHSTVSPPVTVPVASPSAAVTVPSVASPAAVTVPVSSPPTVTPPVTVPVVAPPTVTPPVTVPVESAPTAAPPAQQPPSPALRSPSPVLDFPEASLDLTPEEQSPLRDIPW